MPIFCPQCLAEFRKDKDECPDCGVALVSFDNLPLHCPSCGATYPTGTKRCPDCRKDLALFRSIDELREGKPIDARYKRQAPKGAGSVREVGEECFGDFLDLP
jgi:predicted amidophosphoribosyltransferase